MPVALTSRAVATPILFTSSGSLQKLKQTKKLCNLRKLNHYFFLIQDHNLVTFAKGNYFHNKKRKPRKLKYKKVNA